MPHRPPSAAVRSSPGWRTEVGRVSALGRRVDSHASHDPRSTRHKSAISEACVCVRGYRLAPTRRSDRRACRRASACSRRLSSASSARMSSACSVTSSVAARIRARLSMARGKRTVVWAIGSRSDGFERGGLRPPPCSESTSCPLRSLVVRSVVHRAPFKARSSRSRCCDDLVNIADFILTARRARRTLEAPIPHPGAGGPAVDDPTDIGVGVGPWGGRLCPRAVRGYRTVPVRIQGGGRHGHCCS